MLVACATCGKEFNKRPFQVKRAKRVFCGIRCKGNFQSVPEVQKACKVCGGLFFVRPCDLHKRSVCNKQVCKDESRLGEFASAWRGGKSYRRSGKVVSWRNSVLKRDGYQCVKCGCKVGLTADHIKPWALYKELRYEVSNGQTLCEDCHRLRMKEFYAERKALEAQGLYKREVSSHRVIEVLVCPKCGISFPNIKGQMKFCSKKCKERDHQERLRKARRAAGLCKACGVPSKSYRCLLCQAKLQAARVSRCTTA